MRNTRGTFCLLDVVPPQNRLDGQNSASRALGLGENGSAVRARRIGRGAGAAAVGNCMCMQIHSCRVQSPRRESRDAQSPVSSGRPRGAANRAAPITQFTGIGGPPF